MERIRIKFIGEEQLETGLRELENDLPFCLHENGFPVSATKTIESGYQIKTSKIGAEIYYEKLSDFYYAFTEFLSNFKTIAAKSGKCCVSDFGFMADCSRNAVLNVNTVKRLIRELSKLGYNYLMLYTEDTLEVKSEPYYGYMRGRYSTEEIKEIISYAKIFGIEVVPHIQTLGHLGTLLNNPVYRKVTDHDNVLLAESEDTYRLLDNVIRSISETFESKKINIGMDEVFMLGAGNYKKSYGYKDEKEIYVKHLERVKDICLKYGFEKIYFYSECLYRMLSGSKTHYAANVETFAPWQIENKKKLYPVYWDYYGESTEHYVKAIENHSRFTENTVYAAGAWKWVGFAPANEHTEHKAVPAMAAVKQTGIDDMFVTAWGDDGGEASVFSILPSLLLFSELAYGKSEKDEEYDKKCAFLWGYSGKEFYALDIANRVKQNCQFNGYWGSPCKIAFYEDMLLGIMNNYLPDSASADFEKAAMALSALARKSGKFGYLFDTLYKLCDFDDLKTKTAKEIYEAYKNKDYRAMQNVLAAFKDLKKREKAFYNAFYRQWHAENKSIGFEIQNIRFGGVEKSLEYAEKRLKAWSEQKIEKIEELEQVRLPFDPDCNDLYDSFFHWNDIVSKNYFFHQ